MPNINGLEWTFDTNAETYDNLRPGYPSKLYSDIFAQIALNSTSNAVEIGIGGGQATLPILKTGCSLIAVEYGENLSELCREKFKNFPKFKVVTSKFEDYISENESCDLIYSASAFHWIPEEIGYSKVFDLLKSGGVFARFANHPFGDKGRLKLWEEIQKIYAVYMPNSKSPKPYTEADAESRSKIAEKYGFVDISYKLYHRTRSFSAAEYTKLLSTYSDHIALPENIRNEFYLKIKEAINNHGGTITIYDTIDLQIARKP